MTRKIFIIAGEPSGDALGAGLIRELRIRAKEPLDIIGIGGGLMEQEGLKSLLPMEELCVMGLSEVIGHLPRLIRLIGGVVEEIEKQQPDLVITIDLPDFNFEVGKRIKKRRHSRAKIIHYVAPSVWAWRPERAKKISKFLDGLICLFPFEPQFFTKHSLRAEFVGHPLVEKEADTGAAALFRAEYQIDPDAKILGVFFGSRASELKVMGPVLKETTLILKEQYPELTVIIPTLPSLEFDIRKLLEDWPCEAIIVSNPKDKQGSFAACNMALAVSGTVGLELAWLGVPHVIAYRANPLTYLIVRMMAKVKYAHLANIMLGREAIPEFLQMKCQSLLISRAVLKLLKRPEELEKQMAAFKELRSLLKDTESPSAKAADFVLGFLQK